MSTCSCSNPDCIGTDYHDAVAKTQMSTLASLGRQSPSSAEIFAETQDRINDLRVSLRDQRPLTSPGIQGLITSALHQGGDTEATVPYGTSLSR